MTDLILTYDELTFRQMDSKFIENAVKAAGGPSGKRSEKDALE